MSLIARLMFGLVSLASRNGLAAPPSSGAAPASAIKRRARQTGVRGETLAYWYLRRQGYVLIARNFTVPGVKGEIDLVGYDGPALAFVEVKTRTGAGPDAATPEQAVTYEKRRNLARMARHFLAERRIREAQVRFDVLAIDAPPGRRPALRLHRGAYAPPA